MEILRVENLSKIYGKGKNKVVAVDDVSFSVEKGEFVAIVGRSGGGKSTLLHLIGGVDEASNGNIFIDFQKILFRISSINPRNIYNMNNNFTSFYMF